MTIEMKPVVLLIDEEIEIDGDVKTTIKDFYEMEEYIEDPSDEQIEAFLEEEFKGKAEVTFIASEGVYFNLRGKEEYFRFQKALKIGSQYFNLEQLKRETRERI